MSKLEYLFVSDIDEMLAYNLGPEVERLYMSYKTSPRIMMTSTKRENVSIFNLLPSLVSHLPLLKNKKLPVSLVVESLRMT